MAHEAREVIQAELMRAAGLKLHVRSDAPGARGLLNVPNEKQVPQEAVAMLIVSYHNIGWELSALGRRPEAIQWYQKALPIAEVHLGAAHSLTVRLRRLAEGS